SREGEGREEQRETRREQTGLLRAGEAGESPARVSPGRGGAERSPGAGTVAPGSRDQAGTFWGATGCVQCEQRDAASGISARHSGQARVFGGSALGGLNFLISALMGNTKKKYTVAAMSRNEITSLMKSPIVNLPPWKVKKMFEKSGLFTMAA